MTAAPILVVADVGWARDIAAGPVDPVTAAARMAPGDYDAAALTPYLLHGAVDLAADRDVVVAMTHYPDEAGARVIATLAAAGVHIHAHRPDHPPRAVGEGLIERGGAADIAALDAHAAALPLGAYAAVVADPDLDLPRLRAAARAAAVPVHDSVDGL